MTPKKVIIIEDESMLQGVLVERLSEEGYVVRGFSNAADAFEYMKEEKPSVILTDLVMLNTDGFEILRLLKENVTVCDIPVIILSNLGEDQAIDRAMSLGATDFLVKSNVSLEQIVDRVKEALPEKKK